MKITSRDIFTVGIVLLIFTIIITYEWNGAWAGYRTTIDQNKALTAELLKENHIPTYMLVIVTIVDYVKHSWLCLLLAFLAAGVIHEFVPRNRIIRLMGSGRGILPYLVSAVGGPLLSMCSCSVIPLFGGLYRRGAGLAPATTFLLTAPSFNPAALALTIALISWQFALFRVVFGIASGILVGYVTEKVLHGRIAEPAPIHIQPDETPKNNDSNIQRLKNTLLYSWAFVKMVLPLILAGVIMAGLIKSFLPTSWIITYLGVGLVPIMTAAAMGIFMYTPTLVEVPFIRGLLDLGMGTGASMAFLLTGPALSLPSILGVCRVVSPKVPALYSLLMWICGTIAGLIFWAIMPTF